MKLNLSLLILLGLTASLGAAAQMPITTEDMSGPSQVSSAQATLANSVDSTASARINFVAAARMDAGNATARVNAENATARINSVGDFAILFEGYLDLNYFNGVCGFWLDAFTSTPGFLRRSADR
jgi:hypothetical protein